MTDRYIITFDDYQELLRDTLECVMNPNINMQEEVAKQSAKLLRKRVPTIAKGFFVIDDEGYPECVRFPE